MIPWEEFYLSTGMELPYSSAQPEWTESHLCNLLVKYKNILLISIVWFWSVCKMATEMLAPIFENINNLKTQDATSSILSFVLYINKK